MFKRFFVVIIALTVIGGAGWYYWTHNQNGGAQQQGQGMQQGQGPQPVSVLTLAPQSISLTQSLPGRITAFRQSQVRPQVNGIITERLFEEGAEVEKGRQLYQIDDARYKAALASAEADLKSAKASVKTLQSQAGRYEELVKIDAVSRQEYDDVKAQLDQARAQVAVAQAAIDTAQVNLDYTKVYAPVAGRISRSFMTEGALVTSNQEQPMATITQLDPVYIDMQQSGVKALELRTKIGSPVGLPVRLEAGEGSPYDHTGELKFSEVTVDESSGSVILRAVMPNPDHVLLPGLFVTALLDMGQQENVLLVPQRATTRTPEGSLQVWVVGDDNTAQPRTISAEMAHNSHWVVTDGLKAGEKIVIEGYQKLGPDAEVDPSPWQSGSTDEDEDESADTQEPQSPQEQQNKQD